MAEQGLDELFEALTATERKVLKLDLEGHKHFNIATILSAGRKKRISVNTIKSHMGRINDKLGISGLTKGERERRLQEMKPDFLKWLDSQGQHIEVEQEEEPAEQAGPLDRFTDAAIQ